ncbi:ATP-binding cassette domain-containing protein [Variovorax sp. J22R24]|uniref:ABC transporter ATP-binding protein n=1 Tax=Variovorax gracilis TaxID=3053502 RepID=UPI002576F5A6|nr:ATP-binding cassette domain-containing protein [Variovorax sp. J22R24]MDM0106360.1 ATP-binding cassette domain-containing protein [Variovorax sp. J22R24]
MIDVDLQLTVTDGARRFDLAAQFATDVPFAALYGPSGAGKSLTFQAIAGLLHPSRGHVRLDGRTLFDSARRIDVPAPERRIGYLFQNYALFPHLSVRDNVAFGLTSWRHRHLSREDSDRVDALLHGFDLTAMAQSRPRTLSGGQQQRVALARALACRPQVLLLDEPFAALNPMLRSAVREDLAKMRREWGIPVLMITHDIDDVLELADVAFVYQAGQVVREVNLRDGISRDLAAQRLGVSSLREETPLRGKLRRLLKGE